MITILAGFGGNTQSPLYAAARLAIKFRNSTAEVTDLPAKVTEKTA